MPNDALLLPEKTRIENPHYQRNSASKC